MPKQRERYSNGGTTGGATGPRPIKGFLKKVTSTAINKSPAGQAINVVGNTVRVARGKIAKAILTCDASPVPLAINSPVGTRSW